MDMEITFPGGLAVDAHYKGFTVHTDQAPASGGGGSAPSPFDVFLSSVGTCAGFFALRFCRERQIDTSGLKVGLDFERNPETKRVSRVRIEVKLPPAFPEKYREAIVRAVEGCTVKRHIQDPPVFETVAV
ncbi:MAG: OsmC family protein [Deltaproteobacteria bacterium]|nr:OsmC family protein [Deltaproteobacteria bacterium]